MDYIEYIKKSFNVWKLDEQEIRELNEKTYPISTGAMLAFISITITILFVFLPDILIPTENLLGEEIGVLPAFFLLLAPIFGIFGLGWVFLSFLWSYLWIKIFGGDKDFKKTSEILLVIYMPLLLLNTIISILDSFILILAGILSEMVSLITVFTSIAILILGIYYLVVVVNTISITHNMTQVKTIFAGICSFIGIFIITLIILFTLILAGLGLGGFL